MPKPFGVRKSHEHKIEQEIGMDLHGAVERFLTPRPTSATARDWELLGTGTAMSLGCGLAATAWGEGPSVLLAHGWEGRRTHWGAFVSPLVEAGFRAVAPDAPAHGDSPGTSVNVLEYGAAIVEIGREIGPLAGIVGHSFGAGAAAVALHRGLVAEKAVLIGGPASLTGFIERWGRSQRMNEALLPDFVGLVARRVGAALEDLEITRMVSQVNRPALVIHDRGDLSVPVEDGMAVAAAWPGAKLWVTERYGHSRTLIAKDVVREVVRFLRSIA